MSLPHNGHTYQIDPRGENLNGASAPADASPSQVAGCDSRNFVQLAKGSIANSQTAPPAAR